MWDRCPTRSTNEPMRKSPQEPTGNGAPLWLRGPHTADSPRLRGPAEIASWKCEGDQSRKYRRINRRPLFTTGRQQAVRLSSRLPGDHVQTSCAQGEISHSQSGNPGYPSIKAKCFVRADADEKLLREIWQAAVDGSPVTQTVARPTQIVTDFEKV